MDMSVSVESGDRIKIRRVQRLGTSSLVVTLPKEWVRRVGLKPGDRVLEVVEGSAVRIVPRQLAEEALRSVELDAGELGVPVSRLISCAYVSRIDQLRLRNVSWEAGLEARSAASRLAGVDVASGPGYVEIRVMLDESKVSPDELLSSIARLAVDMTGLVEKLLEEPSPQFIQLVREAYNEIVKYEHLAVRLLSGMVTPNPRVYAAAILGDVAADIWSLANTLATLAETRGAPGKTERLSKLLAGMREALSEVGRAEGLEALRKLLDRVSQLRMEAGRAMIDAEKPVEAAAAATLHHAARYLEIAVNALLCNEMVARIFRTVK